MWWDREGRASLSEAPPLDGDVRCRTVVVGAGVAGISAAIELTLLGDDVVLVDRAHAGAGASTRNAGFVLADSECVSLAAEMHGEPAALALHQAGVATRAAYERLAHRFADPDSVLRVTGSLRLATDDGEAAHFRRTAALGPPGIRLATRAEIDAAGGGAAPAGPWIEGLVDEGDGVTDPVLVIALACALAEALGVRRHDATRIERLEPRPGGGVDAISARGAVRAERVVVATNADAASLVPGFAACLRPVRAQALAARVDPAPRWPRPVYATRGGEYWRVLPDGRAFLGGLRRTALAAEETAALDVNPAIHARLDAYLAALVAGAGADAGASRITVTHRWAGTMGFTPDGAPLAGAVPGRPGVHLLAGWNGHGMGWAPGVAGALAAHLADDGPPLPAAFAPARHLGRNLGAPAAAS